VLAVDAQIAASVGAFSVQSEADLQVELSGVEVKLRIDRLQRFASGAQWVVDYKTGKVTVADWQGKRPRAPQLPIYALVQQQQGEDVAGVAFYALKEAENPRLQGVSRDDVPFSGQGVVDDDQAWQARLQAWQAVCQRLADDFRAGVAVPDPLKHACRYCHLSLLCRQAEWQGVSEDDEASMMGDEVDDE
jgi:hypothetical protein